MDTSGEHEFEEFFDAIKKGDVLAVRRLIESGSKINAGNKFGWTPLMVAAGRGNTPIIEMLLAAGGDVNSVNDHGVSPLACAALDGHWRAIEVLLKNGASVDVRPHGVSLLQFAGWNSGSCDTHRHIEILEKAGAI